MTEPAKILIADDEETFLRSTADLLRREGYVCDTAVDATAAIEMIQAIEYDLLIADIRMPGNTNLELVKALRESGSAKPVILVTGYPSMVSAQTSIGLRIWAYLVKPFDFIELKSEVERSVKYHRSYATLNRTVQELREWRGQMQQAEEVMRNTAAGGHQVSVRTFLSLTMRNLFDAMTDIVQLTEAMADLEGSTEACHLLHCPRASIFREVLRETITTISRTKGAFKSKELGALREKLEKLLDSGI